MQIFEEEEKKNNFFVNTRNLYQQTQLFGIKNICEKPKMNEIKQNIMKKVSHN